MKLIYVITLEERGQKKKERGQVKKSRSEILWTNNHNFFKKKEMKEEDK